MHDLVPVLPSHDAEQERDAVSGGLEVCLPAKRLFQHLGSESNHPCQNCNQILYNLFYISGQQAPEDSPPNALAIFDSAEENAAGQGIREDEEEHAHDDEEALVH